MTTETLVLSTSPRWITVEPAESVLPNKQLLFIDRSTLNASVRERSECAALAEPDSQRVIYGLVGLIESLHDAYLLVISKRKSVGSIMEQPVWRVEKLEAIPVRGPKLIKKLATQLNLTKQHMAEENLLKGMINAAVSLPGFYFSHQLDLTKSAQKRADAASASDDAAAAPDFLRADLRFVWNRFAAKKLMDIGAVSWLVPLILGYVDVRTDVVNGKSVQLALIARRSADRPGLRYTARGADIHGNVSNFVETEQIISHGDAYSSYVQIRGSIPLLWKQEANIKYKPKAVLKEVDSGGKGGLCQKAFEKHFDSLFEQYGTVTAISLVDGNGGEAMLHKALKTAVELMQNSKLHFVPWDFHTKTKGMKYEMVDQDLLPSIDSDLGAYSYFYTKDGTASGIARRQRGVIRTNCIDSLDRTNVVQSAIAHRIMDAALKVMGVLDSNVGSCSAAKFDSFEKQFKDTWADHANALSQVYAGSGALKTDYTRTGKRSKLGMAQDGVRALRRYIYQNFLDGRRQDGIDIILGVVPLPSTAERSLTPQILESVKSKADPLLVWEKYLPHVVLFFFSLACVGYTLIKPLKAKYAMIATGCIGMVFFFKLMLSVGHKLVSRPRLDGTN
ncbi:Phosphatidylinositide phosphatase SAC1 [Gracilariopsis chorda]|uniref:Phosphatidylinositide phosphatase SAC1 n=1 Tax=Gracilariopsis chorda TaxID=448386 RepID=A0A2V3IPJ2_9FLOR|nr:Phosphatidylinositide phosphatase SAC1 [Gracilariopsis chorda]|eukprot:PXF43969.1 Phosphatidylinositide phosphatase SAC1 [Gracilariopsis chorda]